jgi:DNA-directed RNA polymerase specialized sigma24 family protein
MSEINQDELDVPLESESVSADAFAFRNPDVNMSLEYWYKYASNLARLHVPRSCVPLGELSEAINDLTQISVISLWERNASEQVTINSPKSYLSRIVYSKCLDMSRSQKRKPTLSLSLDPDAELQQGKVLFSTSEGMQDPAVEFERMEFIAELIQDVLRLPPKQQYAMICMLKDEVAHSFPIAEIFLNHGKDITNINWPEEKSKLQSLRASISVARKKLRSLLK